MSSRSRSRSLPGEETDGPRSRHAVDDGGELGDRAVTDASPVHSVAPAGAEHGSAGDDAPQTSDSQASFWRRHRRTLAMTTGAVVAFAFVYVVVPRLVGLGPTLKLLRKGDVWWLVLGAVLEVGSYAGAAVLFRGVFARPGNRIDWKASWLITLAGTAATKLIATAGAGGIALTVWALRAYGLSGADIASGMVCWEILTYAVYMFAMAIAGYGLWLGVFSGPAPIGVTLIPAIFATVVIAIVLSMLFVYEPTEQMLMRRADRTTGRASVRWRHLAALPRALHGGLLSAIGMAKRRDRSILGAIAYWGFDISVLWASFRAFGHSPPGAVLVLGYYVGTLGNALPLPGGVGGVEGGMIGTFLAFGVPSHLAVLAVLAYRTISYWLPTVPGAVAYAMLRHAISGSPDHPDAGPSAASPDPSTDARPQP